MGLAVADEVWMLSGAYYSVVSPESCANILWKDAERAAKAAESLKLTAQDLLGFGIIERIIMEPKDYESGALQPEFYNKLSKLIETTLKQLMNMSIDELLNERYEKFRKVGRYDSNCN